MTLATEVHEGVAVVDADSHFTDVADLWTKRAPAAYKDRILHVEEVDGERQWVIEGIAVGKAGGGSTIDRQGVKHPFLESLLEWEFERAHTAAWDVDARLEVLDDMGITHQVLYPNALGLGGQTLGEVKDLKLRRMCLEIFNDSRAEIQERTNNRLLPMPILPAWDIDECVREAQRIGGLGLRGINMTSDPQDLGTPDLANKAWDPLWEVCSDLELPVHFHIGSSLTAMNFYGQYFWESQDEFVKPAIGGSMLFIGNARVVINTIFSGLFDRFPKLKMVSVESGIGWVPFILETMDWELPENAPVQAAAARACALRLLQVELVCHHVVRDRARGPSAAGRQGWRGQHPLRDRLSPPDGAVAQAPRACARGHGHAAPGVAPQDPGRERDQALPPRLSRFGMTPGGVCLTALGVAP